MSDTQKTALVVSAHSADFVWRAGGAIALYASRGWKVKIVCLSYGERGESAKLWREKGMTLEKVKTETEGIKLEDAPVVIGGGRGIGSTEGFEQLKELARLLKGAVGASRPACDSGWVPDTSQIGLTGKIVTPDFYLAVGISGSSQHMAGCSSSKCIVAINKDPEANIFKEARYGVVGDWKKVLPTFIQKVKELLAS